MNVAGSWWFGGFVHFADQGNNATYQVVHVGGNYPVASKLDCMVLYLLTPFHPLPVRMVLSAQHHSKLTGRLEMQVKVVAYDPSWRRGFEHEGSQVVGQ